MRGCDLAWGWFFSSKVWVRRKLNHRLRTGDFSLVLCTGSLTACFHHTDQFNRVSPNSRFGIRDSNMHWSKSFSLGNRSFPNLFRSKDYHVCNVWYFAAAELVKSVVWNGLQGFGRSYSTVACGELVLISALRLPITDVPLHASCHFHCLQHQSWACAAVVSCCHVRSGLIGEFLWFKSGSTRYQYWYNMNYSVTCSSIQKRV